MKERLTAHVVRLAGLVTAVAPLAVAVLDTLPWQWAVSLSAAALAVGEAAQRVENRKTLRALLEPPPAA